MNKLGLLTAIGIGDAFGRPYEFTPEEKLEEFDLTKYAVYQRDNYIDATGIGKYTDDTQMSIAIANHMINGEPLTHSYYAESFFDTYKRDKRDGYSSRIKAILDKSKDYEQLLLEMSLLVPTRSTNGSVMRCLPLGLYPDVERIKQACVIQSSVTHPSLDCIIACQVIALTAHYFYYEIKDAYYFWMIDKVGKEVYSRLADAYGEDEAGYGPVSSNALQTASFCLQNILGTFTMSEILERSIKVMGDVDSTAAISLGLASLNKLCKQDLPYELLSNLENGRFGRDYLIQLDKRLIEKYPKL